MKVLYLLRHSHAQPRGLSFADYDRPLDERGRSEAVAVAGYIQEKKLTFDFVMCSGALRTQETLEPLRSVVGTKAIEISEEFYNNPEDQILKHLRLVSDERQQILFIGHNPGIAFAALKFITVYPPELLEGVAPATLIGFKFPIDHWKDLDWREGEVIDYFQPNLPVTDSPSPAES